MNTTDAAIAIRVRKQIQVGDSKKFLGNHDFDEIIKYNVDVPQVTDVLT
jgi:hypothetical protein